MVNPGLPRLHGHNGPGRRVPFSRWFRYPAGFSQDSINICLAHLKAKPGSTIIDPFAGAATVGTVLASQGVNFRGIEAHPLIAELANLKFGGVDLAPTLVEEARAAIRRTTLSEASEEHVLVQRCFDAGTLEILGGMRNSIAEVESSDVRTYLNWALLGTLRECASVKVGWPYQRPAVKRAPVSTDPRIRFVTRVGFMVQDLLCLEESGRGRITHGDSRHRSVWEAVLPDEKADGCLTSPPYLNNFDYADATRLELYFLRHVATWKEMTTVVRSTMIVASTQQTSLAATQTAQATLSQYQDFDELLEPLATKLTQERKLRKAGKQYDRLLYQYFADMSMVLKNLSDFLVSGGRAAFVVGDSAPYGIFVDTPALIAKLGASFGMILKEDIPIRARGHRWATNTTYKRDLTERVIILENA